MSQLSGLEPEGVDSLSFALNTFNVYYVVMQCTVIKGVISVWVFFLPDFIGEI